MNIEPQKNSENQPEQENNTEGQSWDAPGFKAPAKPTALDMVSDKEKLQRGIEGHQQRGDTAVELKISLDDSFQPVTRGAHPTLHVPNLQRLQYNWDENAYYAELDITKPIDQVLTDLEKIASIPGIRDIHIESIEELY